jgi:hypothetical protein
MPRTCTACSHSHRDDIDRLLLEGAPFRNIAKRFSLSAASLFRHNKHISATLAKSHEEAEIIRADGLLEHLNHLTAEAARLKQKAEQAKDYRTALAGVREMSRILELVIRLAAELEARTIAKGELDTRNVEELSDVELLQLRARERGMTEARFLRIARGASPSGQIAVDTSG